MSAYDLQASCIIVGVIIYRQNFAESKNFLHKAVTAYFTESVLKI